jgi:ADP-ribose pyrophosphatase YjhB (NUDIX family)
MEEEKVLLQATLCYLVKDGQVLLGIKEKKIGKGCWNGFGGGIEPGETPEKAALRELKEEAGVTVFPEHLKKVAIVDFHNQKSDGAFFICQVHVYLAEKWLGEPKATKEMSHPTWFLIQSLPVEKMMLADKDWLPLILEGKKVRAVARYGPFQKTLLGKVKVQRVNYFRETRNSLPPKSRFF